MAGWPYPRFYSRVFKDDCAAIRLSPSHTHSHTPSKGTTVCSSSLSESEQKLCSKPGSERLGSGFRWWKQKDNDHALFGHVIILCPKTHHCNGQCRLTTVMVNDQGCMTRRNCSQYQLRLHVPYYCDETHSHTCDSVKRLFWCIQRRSK